MSEGKCVWVGGHSGLRLAAYGNGTVEARRGDGRLLVAVSAAGLDTERFAGVVLLIRGYKANPTEMGMLRDALDAARCE